MENRFLLSPMGSHYEEDTNKPFLKASTTLHQKKSNSLKIPQKINGILCTLAQLPFRQLLLNPKGNLKCS